MKRILGLLAVVLTVNLAGCATPYQPVGATGGFVDKKIDEQTYHVQFSGNGYTPREKVNKYFMYRCAELTQQAGFKYFTIIPAAISGALPPADHLVSGSGFDPRMMRKVASTPVPIIIYGGGGDGAVRWSNNADIRMFNDDAVIKTRIIGWDAAEILDQLNPYVRSEGKTPADLPKSWVFEPGHDKMRAEDLLPTSPVKPVGS